MHFGSGNVKRTLHVVGTNSLVAEAQPSQTQAHPSNTGLKYTIASRHAWTPGSSENLKKTGQKDQQRSPRESPARTCAERDFKPKRYRFSRCGVRGKSTGHRDPGDGVGRREWDVSEKSPTVHKVTGDGESGVYVKCVLNR